MLTKYYFYHTLILIEKRILLPKKECDSIIDNTKKVLERAIKLGGSTIHSYTSSEGVTGKFQNELYIYGRAHEKCINCGNEVKKDYIGGRGTHYCSKCQK